MAFVLSSPDVISSVAGIKQAILASKGETGRLMTEPEVARRHGFPRPLVRAAVRELAAEGQVAVLPRKGFRLCLDSLKWLESVYGKRFLLEGHVVAKLSEGKTVYATAPLEKSLERQREFLIQGDEEAFSRSDLEFHAELFKVFGSDSLLRKFSGIADRLAYVWRDDGKKKRSSEEILREHTEICQWIRKGDTAKALEALQSHVAASHQCTRAVIGTRQITLPEL